MRIYCDFDGTIATMDATDHVLSQLADRVWEDIESEWISGRIDAAECMRRQIALISASDEQLDATLDAINIDPGFISFVAWCRANDLPLTIVSDGVDYFIKRILARHGLHGLPTITNRLLRDGDTRRLAQPWRRTGCAAGAGVCKCSVVSEAATPDDGPLVYVGDGRSDFCVSSRADILFAKDSLADYAEARNQPFHAYRDFHDVRQRVTAVLDATLPLAI